MRVNSYFPFSAIVGQENIKKALILNVINPNIGGVLISGEKGTGKSTIVRGLSRIMEKIKVIDLPLNITEDRLVGSLDIKSAVRDGRKTCEYGLLKEAHKQFLYIDEVNLLSDHIVNTLLEVSSTGVNNIEREGISECHECKFILIGSMNPEEGILRPQFLDKFGLYVEAKGELDLDNRIEIMYRQLQYEKDRKTFLDKWKKEDLKIRDRINKGINNLSKVEVWEENYSFAASLSKEGRCEGNRAEIVMIETAKAIAALEGNSFISMDNIKEAASFVLPHRIREGISLEADKQENHKEESYQDNNENMEVEENTYEEESSYEEKGLDEVEKSEPNGLDKPSTYPDNEIANTEEDNIEEIIPMSKKLNIDMEFGVDLDVKGTGKRTKVKSDSKEGRYVKYRIPKGRVEDIAFDATFRLAACNQRNRESEEVAIVIKDKDFREKVREKRTGVNILFLVDSSGSMGAKKRMGAVKGAVIALLNDAYQKRDKVGVIAFRRTEAQVLLNTTRSVDLAERCLKYLPTGGKTPLALGLYRAYELLKIEKIKYPDTLQYLIIVSDGKANVALNTDNAVEDALTMGEKIRNEGIKTMIMDTENSYIQYGLSEKLSKVMDSKYIKLKEVSKNNINLKVKNFINIK